jgi:phosphatidylserine/phosphatidylglycerophosphate/cardiolipin synthase-like enzyme
MWFSRKSEKRSISEEIVTSKLFDDETFYDAFMRDLTHATGEVIIESPFITTARMRSLRPIFQKLLHNSIKVFVITRSPQEHDGDLMQQAEAEIRNFELIGVQTLICRNSPHRKLAMIDRQVLWEGSLNILSQYKSGEIMRRIEGKSCAQEMFDFLRLERYI